MKVRQSSTLTINNGFTCCTKCLAEIGPAGKPWKQSAALTITKVCNIPGSTSSTHPQVELRHFSCPNCSALLDSETALPEDPFLDDVLNP
jgi:acetone carboxylase gamma subunit